MGAADNIYREARTEVHGALMRTHRPSSFAAASIASGLLSACSGSPSRNILGSYFPSWMVCALLALVLTALVRVLFGRTGIDAALPAPLLVYLALFAAFTFGLWLIWLA